MDQQAATLLATLRRTSAASESKLTLLNTLKSDIKHHRVPENAQPIIFDCLKYAISQQSSSTIATAALTTLSHLVKRLKIQDPEGAAIVAHAPRLYSALQDRLGDLRESHRAGASQALVDLWPFCNDDIEDLIRDDCIANGSVRAKEAGMQWVVKMNREAALPFKGFVPHMVLNLEDSDGNVRDAAKTALIDLFKHAPDRAKADLKKQLNMHSVRAGIAAQLLNNIESSAPPPEPELTMTASTRTVPTFDPRFTESINSEAAKPPPTEEIPMDPIHVHSQRELEDELRDMLPAFEGRESEENWILRDRSVTKLRRITKGNAATDYYNAYMAGIKQLQEGIIKVANSLRTTTSTNACQLVQELARTLGPALDPMVEIYAQSFIKMSAATKNIAAQNGMHTVDTLFQYVSVNARVMQHIWFAAQDKNIQPRSFAATWLRTVLSRQASSKSHFEHIGGLELADKTIKKGLNDPQPKVRESMRATYWTFAKTWPEKAAAIMNTLDDKAKTALERDSHNPNSSSATLQAGNLRASTTSRAQSRTSVRDAILAARKNMGKSQGERPVSAMAAPTLSPATSRCKSSNNLSARQPSASSTSSRTPSTHSTTSTGRSNESASSSTSTVRPNALMSGAARRPTKRPEPPRPATAEPFASRRLLRPETPSNKSPANSPRQEAAASLARTAAGSAARKKLEVDSPVASPARQPASPRHVAPAPRLPSASPAPASAAGSRPTSKDGKTPGSDDNSFARDEELTMVIPTASVTRSRQTSPVATRQRPTINKSMSAQADFQSAARDESFPEVVHEDAGTPQPRSPLPRYSPRKSISEETTQIPAPTSPRSPMSGARRLSGRAVVEIPQARAPSVPRQSSPLKTSTNAPVEEFQIHEDSVNGRALTPESTTPPMAETRVLNELPVNESSNQDPKSPTPADGARRNGEPTPPMSPESKAESVRSRKLLLSGIERIKSRTLDAHGFRKVLELVRSSDSGDIFGSVGEGKRFDDLCHGLIDYIVDTPTDLAGNNVRHSHELKRQAISILWALVNKQQPTYRKWLSSGRWCTRTLAGVFDSRRGVEGQGLLVKDLEGLAVEIAGQVHPEEGEKAVLTWLEQDNEQSNHVDELQDDAIMAQRHSAEAKSRARATALALRTLSTILTNHKTVPVLAEISTRIASITAMCLKSNDAEVRKAAVELALELHDTWPPVAAATNGAAASPAINGNKSNGTDSETKSDYWSLLERSGIPLDARNLIVYFVARRARGT
ncbi:hypothetical protein AAFC00_002252 [Neodothiora populina]|uniref:TOG domain-containing protein n=1 Tax=Neodothiora populina TaxID=2781224 RepID=A0ABR3PGU0_9PEZI